LNKVTLILSAIEQGDAKASGHLPHLVSDEVLALDEALDKLARKAVNAASTTQRVDLQSQPCEIGSARLP
jgi:hypothetical protein